jgi:uncharacterized protein
MIEKLLIEIWIVFLQMAPYLLFGLTIAGVLHVFFDRKFIIKHLGENNLFSVIKASLLGVPIPLCSCGVIPTALSLRKNDASKGATISFLISTPQTGVDSIAATYGMLGPVFAIFRPVVSFIMGIIGGYFVNLIDKDGTHHIHEKGQDVCEKCKVKENVTKEDVSFFGRIKEIIYYAYFDFLDDIAANLLIGIIIAGIISFVVPDNFFAMYVNNDLLSMLLMIVAGIPLYICATASIPIAVSLILKGLSPGAAFVFLAVGPATNAATMTMILKEMGKSVFAIYISVIAISSILAGFILNWVFSLFGTESLNLAISMHLHAEDTNIFLSIGSWIFLFFLALSLLRNMKTRIKKIFRWK